MKLLFIGNKNHIYIQELMKNITIKCNYDVQILNTNFFDNSKKNFRIKYISRFSRFLERLYYIKQVNPDIVNIHYIRSSYRYYLNVLRKNRSNYIITIWGSDFYRVSEKERRKQKILFEYSKFITFTNPVTKKDFINYYGPEYEEKSKVCRFGLTPLESIKKAPNKDGCVKEFYLNPYKYKVTVGYSSTNGHQHIGILKSLKRAPNLRKNCQFIIPLTYGDANYRSTLKDYIEKEHKEDDIIILENFLSMDDVAKLRKATDIMINTPITDQFSGSMQETLFAKNIVINGSWLPYGLLKERGVYFEEVDRIEEIPHKLEYIIDNYERLKEKCERNPEIIWDLSSWEKNIDSWLELYEKALEIKE